MTCRARHVLFVDYINSGICISNCVYLHSLVIGWKVPIVYIYSLMIGWKVPIVYTQIRDWLESSNCVHIQLSDWLEIRRRVQGIKVYLVLYVLLYEKNHNLYTRSQAILGNLFLKRDMSITYQVITSMPYWLRVLSDVKGRSIS